MEKGPSMKSGHDHLRSLYAKVYGSDSAVFGREPNYAVSKIPDPHISKNALDVGSGDGRHSIYLAKRGFTVDAVDLSETGIGSLQKQARQEGVESSITTNIGALENLDLSNQQFETIVCSFVLHHVKDQTARQMLQTIMAHTAPGGTNAISVFTNRGDFASLPDAHEHFYPTSNELREIYERAGWELLEYTTQEQGTRSGKRNETADMLARKAN